MKRLPTFACLFLAACGADESVPEVQLDVSHRVAWALPQAEARVPVATLPAEVVASPEGEAYLGPGVDGRLIAWEVAPGDTVAVGQRLARVQSAELTALAQEVQSLQAAEVRAKAALQLAEAAVGAGVGTAQEVAVVREDLGSVSGRLVALRSELSAHQGSLVPERGGWAWLSPRAGTVEALDCLLGPLDRQDDCLRLVGSAEGTTEVHVPERLLGEVDRAGAALTATWTSVDEQTRPVRLLSVATALDRRTRQLTLRFGAPADVRVGASGRLTLEVPGDNIASVPSSAVMVVEGAPAVFVRAGTDGVPVPGLEGARMVHVEEVGRGAGRTFVRGLPDPSVEVAHKGTFLLKSLVLGGEE